MFQHQPTRTHSTEHEVTLNSPLPMQKTLPTTSPIVPVSGPIRFHNHHNVNPLDVSAITRPMPPLWGPLSSQYYTRTDPLYSWCLAPNPISVPTTSTNTMLGAPSVPCMTDSRFLNRLRDQDIRQSGMPLPYWNLNGNGFVYDFRLTKDDASMTCSNTSFWHVSVRLCRRFIRKDDLPRFWLAWTPFWLRTMAPSYRLCFLDFWLSSRLSNAYYNDYHYGLFRLFRHYCSSMDR